MNTLTLPEMADLRRRMVERQIEARRALHARAGGLDRTEAVHPIPTRELAGMPDTYPFGI